MAQKAALRFVKFLFSFGLYFASAVYVLALPFFFLFNGAVDWLLPYEAVFCVVLSGGLFGLSGREVVRIAKVK